MAQQNIIIGAANAKDGDTIYDAFGKVVSNFSDLDTRSKVTEGVAPLAVAGGQFVSDGAGGGEFIRIAGFEQYTDTDTTVGTPSLSIASGVRTLLPCDGGSLSITKPPSDLINPMWNVTTSKLQPIALFDQYSVRLTFKAENYAGTGPYIKIELDIGGTLGVIVGKTAVLARSGSVQNAMMSFRFFAGSTFLANGGAFYITYTGTGSVDIFDTNIYISRESKNYV